MPLLLLLFPAGVVMAQSPRISVTLPTVTPPSPTAQAFMRYGEIPVDPSTGVPSISIPLYTLGSKNMTVPLSLSYHASGIKVNDVPSEVGLGWVLNTGGIIARTVNGRPDELKSGIKTFANAAQLMSRVKSGVNVWKPSCSCLDSIMELEHFFNGNFVDAEDYMSDRYFYKLPNGTSGVFTYDYSSMADDETSLIMLPYRPFRIEKFNSPGSIDSLRITDDNGIRYSYGYHQATRPTSEWVLKRIVSADGKEVIKFKYILQSNSASYASQTKVHTYYGPVKRSDFNCGPNGDAWSYMSESLTAPTFSGTPILDEIISSEAIVKFTYGPRDDFSYLKRLTGITIAPVTAPTSFIKIFQLTHSYFGSTPADKRLRLDNVSVTAPGVAQPQKHTFTYESQTLPPYPMKMTYPTYPHPTYSEDFWGYYNGANSTYLTPSEFITNNSTTPSQSSNQQLFGGNRHAGDSTLSRACMLKEIKYPTGGRTVFHFGRSFGTIMPNGGGIPGGEYGGGFRVESITNYNGITGVANVKTYEYGDAVTRPIRKEDFSYDQRMNEDGTETGRPSFHCWAPFAREMVFSSALLPLEVAPGMPIMYRGVVEYNGTKTHNAGKTVYQYDDPYSPSDFGSQPNYDARYEMPFHYHPYHYDKGNYSPQLIAKEEYAFDGVNYHLVSRVANTYTKRYTREFKTGIKLSRPERYQSPTYFVFSGCNILPCDFTYVKQAYIASVIALDTKAFQESSLLTQTKNYAYDPLDSAKYVLTTTEYAYNEHNLAVREQSTRTSSGEVFKTTYKYPHDFSSVAPYDHMVTAKHLLSPVIESNTYKTSTNTVPLESTKMRYDFWNYNTDQIYPAEVSTKPYNSSVYEPRVRYLAYDQKGNVLSVSKASDVPTSYIWGYGGQYPIAEVRNAAPAEIAYTSFEDASPGGWSFNGSTVTTAFTGKRGYVLDGTSATDVRRDQLPAGKYELTMWAHGTNVPQVSVSGSNLSAPQLLTEVPSGWRQYRFRVSVPANGVITVNSNQQYLWLDELRLYPVGAQVTSYTHALLIGMTSQTDPSGRTIFYEYDAFGRLLRTRDAQGRLLSQQEYHYVRP